MRASAEPGLIKTGAAEKNHRQFALFAWIVLLYNIPVILWGAYVRISFSGDGCGADWPFCHGQVLPQNMAKPMAIEFTHRVMTSLDLVLMGALLVWAFRAFPKLHAVRRYAVWSGVFLLVEALLGAGLVLLRKVAHDQSAGRAIYLSAHLTNTMLLLAALAVTAWAAHTATERIYLTRMSRRSAWALVITIAVSVTGALAALGDTLFPAASLAAGMQQDFSSASHALLRLRLFHPVVAVAGAAYLLWAAGKIIRRGEEEHGRTAALMVLLLTVLQLGLGAMNIALLAPVWMQLLHLFVADAVWISVVVLALASLGSGLAARGGLQGD